MTTNTDTKLRGDLAPLTTALQIQRKLEFLVGTFRGRAERTPESAPAQRAALFAKAAALQEILVLMARTDGDRVSRQGQARDYNLMVAQNILRARGDGIVSYNGLTEVANQVAR